METNRLKKASGCRSLIRVVLTSICAVSSLLSQADNHVSGIITDQSGAVLVGASVSAKNLATNVETDVKSNDSGYYLLQLPIGTYNISVSSPGLRTTVHENIQVSVGADVGLDVQLEIGTAQQSVEVLGGTTSLITPNSSSAQTTVGAELVSNLPLAVSGGIRNSADFLKLTPGYQGTTFSARLNGGVGLDQEVTVDGATVSPVAFGAGIQGNQNTVPGFAIKEFQVIGSNIDAQYGRTSSGVIKYVYKSGTNSFHGSAFEYLKNQALDARNFFAPTVAADHQNEFGAELGGPVIIPHVYNGRNRTFFYAYYDGFRYTNTNPGAIYSVLTPQMRSGDFSAAGLPAIYDPSTTRPDGQGGFTRDQFPANKIPAGSVSSISNYFANLLPAPNLPGLANNYRGTSTSTNNMDQGLIKIDQSLHNGQLSISYNDTRSPTSTVGPFGQILSGTLSDQFGHRAIVNWDQILKPNQLNHFSGSFNRWAFFTHQGGQQDLGSGSDLNQKAGLAGVLDQSGQATINLGQVTNGQSGSTLGNYYLGIGGAINKIAHQNWRIADDYTWTHEGHSFQFGFMQNRYYTTGLQQAGGFTPFGTFSFEPQETGLPGEQSTGFSAASFLLGQVDQGTYGQQPSQAFLFRNWGIYAQDSWKIRRNLTLNFGLRWEHEPPIRDKLDRLANFDPTVPNPGADGRLGALVFAGSGAGRTGRDQFADSWFGGFGPRIGLSYSPFKDTVLRGAYGLMYDTNAGPAIFLNQQGYFTQATLNSLNAGVSPAFNWAIGFPAVPQGPYFDPTFANGGSTSWMQPNGARLPMVENWNVGIQQMLPGNFMLDLSYVGTAAHHLLNGNLDYNQLNPQYLGLGSLLNTDISSSAANTAGIPNPYPGFQGSVAQALRPYPQYQAITMSSNPVGNSTYNALQIRAQKRYSNGMSFLISYTLSKNLTDADGEGGGSFLGSAQDYYNLRLEKAVTAADVPQAFVAAYTYDLPFGAGKALRSGSNVVDKYLLGSWTLSGIVTLQRGAPLGITTELSLPAIGPVRPNVLSSQVYLQHDRSSFDPAKDLYLNLAAFAAPAPFTFGNAPRLFSQFRSFGTEQWDAALQKSIPIRESVRLALKIELFNLLNNVNFGVPVTDINNPGFGQITSAAAARTGQISGTLIW